MGMPSKHPGTCRKCGRSFPVGTMIDWSKAAGSTHVTCPTASTTGAEAAVGVDKAPFEVREKWSACRAAAHQGRLVAVIGETRRYVLCPATRRVRGEAARVRHQNQPCSVCGVASSAQCVPPDGASTQEASYFTPGAGWTKGPACMLPAVPDRFDPVSDEEQRRNLPTLRAGAAGTSEPGLYVVVGAGPWRFQNATDNEDMGDMHGANWSGVLYLRQATAEEIEKDERKQLGATIPAIFEALAKMDVRGVERRARADMEVAAAREGWSRVALDYAAALGDEVLEARKGARRLWSDDKGSYVKSFEFGGDTLFESHHYVHDWDQPIVVVGPIEIVERAAVAQSFVGLGWALRRVADRMDREAKAAADLAAREVKRLPEGTDLGATFGIEIDDGRRAAS